MSSLNKKGLKAVSITSKNNNIINVIPEKKELGFVGIPTMIDKNNLEKIIDSKKIPVVAPLGLDENNQTYNINGDTALTQ